VRSTTLRRDGRTTYPSALDGRQARDFAHLASISEKDHDCVRNPTLRAQSMKDDDLSFLPLRVTRVGVSGKQSFEPMDKRRLVQACLGPGASLSGLALMPANANQLQHLNGRLRPGPAFLHGCRLPGAPSSHT